MITGLAGDGPVIQQCPDRMHDACGRTTCHQPMLFYRARTDCISSWLDCVLTLSTSKHIFLYTSAFVNVLHLHSHGKLSTSEGAISVHIRWAMPDYLDVETWGSEDEPSPSGKLSIDELVTHLVIRLPYPVYHTHP